MLYLKFKNYDISDIELKSFFYLYIDSLNVEKHDSLSFR